MSTGLKNVEDMTLEEMKREIQKYIDEQFDRDEKFVFISYSHSDSLIVYRTILPWMRDGYNIYIDLDFKNQTSNINWVETMKTRITSSNCALALVFRSAHYYWSLAALVELLTMRSKETKNRREGADDPTLPVDVIIVEDDTKCKEITKGSSFRREYKESFEKIVKERRKDDTFPKNKSEEPLLREGFAALNEGLNDAAKADFFEMLAEKYLKAESFIDYYGYIEAIIKKYFTAFDFNGNTKRLSETGDKEKDLFDRKEIFCWRNDFADDPDDAAGVTESKTEEKPQENAESRQPEKAKEKQVQPEKTGEKSQEKTDGKVYHLTVRTGNFDAKYRCAEGGFLVLRGSKIYEANFSPKKLLKANANKISHGVLTDDIFVPGNAGVLSRFISGTANYEKKIEEELAAGGAREFAPGEETVGTEKGSSNKATAEKVPKKAPESTKTSGKAEPAFEPIPGKAEAVAYLKQKGVRITEALTYAAYLESGRGYWANAKPDRLSQDWSIVLNNKLTGKIAVFLIPADTLILSDIPGAGMKIRPDRGLVDILISDDDDYTERKSQISMKPYLVAEYHYDVDAPAPAASVSGTAGNAGAKAGKASGSGELVFQKARAVEKDGKIVVLKDSRLKLSTAPSCPNRAKMDREEALSSGRIKEENGEYVVLEDIAFPSKSAAACFVSGLSTNGNLAWK